MGSSSVPGLLMMKRTPLLLTIGLGSVLAEIGGVLCRAGVEMEMWGKRRLTSRHVIYESNAEVNSYTNGQARRVPHPNR